jgi:hypothetical protein
MSTNIPKKERALVLQGGGSLGAYEAGTKLLIFQWALLMNYYVKAIMILMSL